MQRRWLPVRSGAQVAKVWPKIIDDLGRLRALICRPIWLLDCRLAVAQFELSVGALKPCSLCPFGTLSSGRSGGQKWHSARGPIRNGQQVGVIEQRFELMDRPVWLGNKVKRGSPLLAPFWLFGVARLRWTGGDKVAVPLSAVASRRRWPISNSLGARVGRFVDSASQNKSPKQCTIQVHSAALLICCLRPLGPP